MFDGCRWTVFWQWPIIVMIPHNGATKCPNNVPGYKTVVALKGDSQEERTGKSKDLIPYYHHA